MSEVYASLPAFAGDLLREELAHVMENEDGWSARDTANEVGRFIDAAFQAGYSIGRIYARSDDYSEEFEEGFIQEPGTFFAFNAAGDMQGLFAEGRITISKRNYRR